jgi:hypothetical protein
MEKITYRLLLGNEPKTLCFYEFSEPIKCIDQRGNPDENYLNRLIENHYKNMEVAHA